MSNVDAFEQTLSELKRQGRVEKIDEAMVEAVRSMAASLDRKPFNSQMFHEYLQAVGVLTADGDSDGSVEALLADLQGS